MSFYRTITSRGNKYRQLVESRWNPEKKQSQIVEIQVKDNRSLQELVIPDREVYVYQADSTDPPVFVTYPYIHRGTETDIGEFMYTWLRSVNMKTINFSDTFGIMEVTSLNDGIIELRNKEPIDLASGKIIRLMGNITFEVSNSTTYLQFFPNSTWWYGTVPSVIETIFSEIAPMIKTVDGKKYDKVTANLMLEGPITGRILS